MKSISEELRRELSIPSSAFTDEQLIEYFSQSDKLIVDTTNFLTFNLACFEISRKIADTRSMEFYKNKILGRLGVICET
jgi:hypothetical protein